MIAVTIALSVAAVQTSTSAFIVGPHASYTSGNKLLRVCTSDEPFDKTICLGYVSGAVDTLQFAGSVKQSPLGFCLPLQPPPEEGQFVDIVVQYLTSHPQYRQWGGGQVIYMAMAEAFPCYAKKPRR
jgi:hypothetical protein